MDAISKDIIDQMIPYIKQVARYFGINGRYTPNEIHRLINCKGINSRARKCDFRFPDTPGYDWHEEVTFQSGSFSCSLIPSEIPGIAYKLGCHQRLDI